MISSFLMFTWRGASRLAGDRVVSLVSSLGDFGYSYSPTRPIQALEE